MSEQVKNPKHYDLLGDITAIDIIAGSLTEDEFKGFCLGNIIKYKLRAGNKDAALIDIAKADNYRIIFDDKKHLCKVK